MLEAPIPTPLWRKALLRIWQVVGGGVVVVVVGLYWWDDQFNKPFLEANAFFRGIGRIGTHASYLRASPKFRAAIDEPAFARLVANTRLDQVKGGGWNDRDFGGSDADMGGMLYLRGGAKLPAVVRLSRAPWLWRVTGLEVAGAPRIGAAPPRVKGLALAAPPSQADAATALPSPPRTDDRVVGDPGGIVIAHPPHFGAT